MAWAKYLNADVKNKKIFSNVVLRNRTQPWHSLPPPGYQAAKKTFRSPPNKLTPQQIAVGDFVHTDRYMALSSTYQREVPCPATANLITSKAMADTISKNYEKFHVNEQ